MRRPTVLFALALTTAACSGSSTLQEAADGGSSSGSSGSGSSGSSGGGGGSSGSSGSSGSEPDGGAEPQETKVGSITISSTHYAIGATPVEMGSASGTFYRVPPPTGGASSACTETPEGACTLTTCNAAPSGDAGASAIEYTHAGPLEVSGVLVNDGTMSLQPGGYGYATVSGSVAFFMGGEPIRVHAAGNAAAGGAPAFDVTQTAPGTVTVTAPVFDTQSRVAVNAGAPLAVSWSGAGSSDVLAQVAAGTSSRSAVGRCIFPGGGGSGSIPAAVFAAAQAAGGTGVSFSVTVLAHHRETKDGWRIDVDLQSYGLRPGGANLAIGLVDVR
ncbi:MAG: hypothetical protein JWP97_4543 [Labilithrix sp.]|nr:hypothetical protein [Labilithrix sp.]